MTQMSIFVFFVSTVEIFVTTVSTIIILSLCYILLFFNNILKWRIYYLEIMYVSKFNSLIKYSSMYTFFWCHERWLHFYRLTLYFHTYYSFYYYDLILLLRGIYTRRSFRTAFDDIVVTSVWHRFGIIKWRW